MVQYSTPGPRYEFYAEAHEDYPADAACYTNEINGAPDVEGLLRFDENALTRMEEIIGEGLPVGKSATTNPGRPVRGPYYGRG